MRRAVVLLSLALVVALAGCGLGAGSPSKGAGVQLTVSRNFGAEPLRDTGQKKIPAGETVMRLLQRKLDVKTRYGGGFVQEIDGISGGRRSGRPVDWFYYVNGIEAENGAAARRLYPGDRVWWDHHDWGGAMRIPAVVGSYPEPFVSGSGGKQLPIRIACAEGSQRSCDEVRTRLEDAGAKVGGMSTVGSPAEGGVLQVLVGPWSAIRRDAAARRLEEGPKVSGVFALPSPKGDHLALLDPRGAKVRSLGPGSGLVAATSVADQRPTWVVTGTDAVGVDAAAAALDETRLKDHFAVAIENGSGIAVPLPAGGGTVNP